MIEKEDIAAVFATLSACFPRFKFDPSTIRAYHKLLSDLSIEQLFAAAVYVAHTSKFFPTPGELRTACFDLHELDEDKMSGEAAWAEVADHMKHGRTHIKVFSNETMDEVVYRLGGLSTMGRSTNAVADRARFIRYYNDLHQRAKELRRMLPQVRGYLEDMHAEIREERLSFSPERRSNGNSSMLAIKELLPDLPETHQLREEMEIYPVSEAKKEAVEESTNSENNVGGGLDGDDGSNGKGTRPESPHAAEVRKIFLSPDSD